MTSGRTATITAKQANSLKLDQHFYCFDDIRQQASGFAVDAMTSFDSYGLQGLSVTCRADESNWPFWQFDAMQKTGDGRWLEGFAYFEGPEAAPFWERVSSGQVYDPSQGCLVHLRKAEGKSVLESLWALSFGGDGRALCPIVYLSPSAPVPGELARQVHSNDPAIALAGFLALLDFVRAAIVFNLSHPISFVFASTKGRSATFSLLQELGLSGAQQTNASASLRPSMDDIKKRTE